MDGLKLSKMSATFVTFLLSALCHELVMAVLYKKIRPYLFPMQVRHSWLNSMRKEAEPSRGSSMLIDRWHKYR